VSRFFALSQHNPRCVLTAACGSTNVSPSSCGAPSHSPSREDWNISQLAALPLRSASGLTALPLPPRKLPPPAAAALPQVLTEYEREREERIKAGAGMYIPPRHPTYSKPSFHELNSIV